MTPKDIWKLLKETAASWSEDRVPSMGAALAYYTTFSIAPLLLIVISVAGLVFGVEAAHGELVEQLRGLMGEEGARAVESLIQSVSEPKQSALASLVGVAILLVGATTVFAELQSSLNRIWRVPESKRSTGIWKVLRERLLSFGMIIGIGFLLMVSLIFSAGLAALQKWWAPAFEGFEFVAPTVDTVAGFVLTTAAFAMIYKLIPRISVAWSDVLVGSAVTALLFTIGKYVIGLYLGRSTITSGFGAAGSLVIMLAWVYYSSQIFLLGAEFTAVYAHTHGSRRGKPRGRAPLPDKVAADS